MAILYGHTTHEQETPDMAYEAHTFGHYTRPTGTQVYEAPTSENPHTFQGSGNTWEDGLTTRRLYEGMPGIQAVDMGPRARVFVKAKFPVIDHSWRTSDKPTGRIVCEVEGCDWWCGAHNAHKMVTHVGKKHGGA